MGVLLRLKLRQYNFLSTCTYPIKIKINIVIPGGSYLGQKYLIKNNIY